MMTHVDWLTIVGHRTAEPADWTVHSAYITASDWLEARSATFREAFECPLDWQIVKPRAPYSYARRSPDNTRTLYVHPLAAHFTLEVSGAWCSRIPDLMPVILRDFADCLSRVDIAVDMTCATTPLAFDAACNPARIASRSRMQSSTGETVYIGARSSERFARVYRYNPPHPRSHLLRAEFQLKGEYAKACGRDVGDGTSLGAIAASLGRVFGFGHPDWQPDAQPSPLKVASHAQTGNTVFWLTNTIAPLLRRLQREGKLDIDAWIAEYVHQNT
jgi:hypothetical protein